MKKIILIIMIILIIIVFAILGILLQNRTIETEPNYDTSIIIPEKNEEKKTESVQSDTAYFTVRACAEKYINYLATNDLEIVYNLLDYKYIEEFKITIDNIQNYVEKVYEDNILKIDKMYVQTIDDNNQIYYIKGNLIEIIGGEEASYGQKKEFVVTININHENMTFTVIPFGYGGVFYE